MTTYNTGNPIGSTAVKDLYDNAENLDHLVNDPTAETWPDRLGVQRKTWHGIEVQAQLNIDAAEDARDDAVAAAGAIGPIEFYDTYADALASAAGARRLAEIATDETRDGSRTRYWAEAGALVFVVNLDQLRIDLAAGEGGGIVGYDGERNYASGTIGAVMHDMVVNVKSFPWLAKGTGTGDDTAAIQAAADWLEANGGGQMLLPRGIYPITSVRIGARVDVMGKGRGVSVLLATQDNMNGALILDSVYAQEGLHQFESHCANFSVIRKDRTKTGVGIWMRRFYRSTLLDVHVAGFERGIDTQGASWASKIIGGTVEYNKYGIYHQAASATFIKVTDQVAPYDRTNSGFNGGSVTGTEIRQNEYGVYYGNQGLPGFHSANVTYDKCIIEGNDKQGICTSGQSSNVNVINVYFERNARNAGLAKLSDYIANPAGISAANVASHIISIGNTNSGDSTSTYINIQGCYFQNDSVSFGHVIAYMCATAVPNAVISGCQGFISGVHFSQFANTARMGNISIFGNSFTELFYGNDLTYAPRGAIVSDESGKVSSASGNMVFTASSQSRAFLTGSAIFGRASALTVVIPLPKNTVAVGKAVACIKGSAHTLSNVNLDKIYVSKTTVSNSSVTVVVGHADPTNNFVAGDSVAIDVYVETI